MIVMVAVEGAAVSMVTFPPPSEPTPDTVKWVVRVLTVSTPVAVTVWVTTMWAASRTLKA